MNRSTQEFIEINNIEDGIVTLAAGGAAIVIQTNGVNFELLSENEKNATIAAFSSLLNSLSFPVQIIVRNEKKDIGPYLTLLANSIQKTSNPKIRQQMEQYRSFIQGLTQKDSVLEKTFLIVIPFYKYEAGIKSPETSEVKKVLYPRRDQILSQLLHLGLRGKMLTDQELLVLFHNIFNSEVPLPKDIETKPDNLPAGRQDLRDLIAPPSVEVDFSSVKIGSRFYKTLFVLDYPRFVSPNWLSQLINFEHTLDIAFFCYPARSGDVLSDLKRKIAEMEATLESDLQQGKVEDPKLRAQLEDAYLLQEELVKGTERFFQFGLYITIPADSKEELEQVSKLIQNTLASLLLLAKPATLQMEDGFKTTLPLGLDRLFITRNMDTTSLSSTFPFTTSTLSENKGILYGVNKHNETLVIFDRFSLENANSVVFGKSGGGKSYLVKLEILRTLMFGGEIIVIDPEREYEKLALAVGGVYIPFSTTTPSKINPFDLPAGELSDEENELAGKISSLHTLLKIMLGGVTPVETATLDRALLSTYAKAGITEDPSTQKNPAPVMEDLYNTLVATSDPTALGVANRLERFIKGSLAGIFNQRSNVQINNPFTVFSIRDLEEEIRPIGMFLILDYIWTKIRRDLRRRILVVDEAWYLMKYEDSASFLFGVAKRARKYLLGLTTITQDVEDFLSSSYGKPILSNSSIQILLKQSPASIDVVAKTFYLSEGEKHFLLSSSIGEGLFFAGQNHVGIKVISASFEHELIVSSPQQQTNINE